MSTNLEEIVEVGFALVLVGQLGADVFLQFAVVNVQHEFGHHLLRIWEDLQKIPKQRF